MNEHTRPASLDDFRAFLDSLPGADETAADRARAREPQLTKPPGSLGRLEELSEWLAAWQGRHPPSIGKPTARVFAGNHGITEKGVSAYPSEVTAQMVLNFEAGGAAINQLCRTFDVELAVAALDLGDPTNDFTEEAAMDEDDCLAAILTGMDAVPDEADALCLGEMGIGNTTSAAAICHALYGGAAGDWTGAGTGVTGEALSAKVEVVGEAVVLHHHLAIDGVDFLRRLGGRELAAIAGAVVAARFKRIPVMLDGFISTAAAATLEATRKGALDHCQIAHLSAEPGHKLLSEALGKNPIFDLGMRLGEASGAVLAVGVLRAAAACHGGMATFAEAGVTDKE